jgi:hypothetical protein
VMKMPGYSLAHHECALSAACAAHRVYMKASPSCAEIVTAAAAKNPWEREREREREPEEEEER